MRADLIDLMTERSQLMLQPIPNPEAEAILFAVMWMLVNHHFPTPQLRNAMCQACYLITPQAEEQIPDVLTKVWDRINIPVVTQ